MRTFEGDLLGRGWRFAIVIARFNETIGRRLLDGALDGLRRHGVADEAIAVAWVPGAFEIPLVARRLAATSEYDAVICLGAVIRGATPHFDYVAGNVAAGVAAAVAYSRASIGKPSCSLASTVSSPCSCKA